MNFQLFTQCHTASIYILWFPMHHAHSLYDPSYPFKIHIFNNFILYMQINNKFLIILKNNRVNSINNAIIK